MPTPINATVTALAVMVLAGCGAGNATDNASPVVAPAGSDVATDPSPATPSLPPDTPEATADQAFPDVLDARVTATGDTWSVDATISSPYDSPARYADAFRVLAPDGTELGVRVLTHDHANEQPFTRTLPDVMIPDGVEQVTIEGRDQANGWGGATVTVDVPR